MEILGETPESRGDHTDALTRTHGENQEMLLLLLLPKVLGTVVKSRFLDLRVPHSIVHDSAGRWRACQLHHILPRIQSINGRVIKRRY